MEQQGSINISEHKVNGNITVSTAHLEVKKEESPLSNSFLTGLYWVIERVNIDPSIPRYIELITNNGFSDIPDSKFPRSMVVTDKKTESQFQIIQLPNSLEKIRPTRDLDCIDGKMRIGKLCRVSGLYGNSKHIAYKEETILELFGVEEAFHALCQAASRGYIFANQEDKGLNNQPKTQMEEDCHPSEFTALIVQYLYLEEKHPEETVATSHVLSRIQAVTASLNSRPYPDYTQSSVSLVIEKVRDLFPNS